MEDIEKTYRAFSTKTLKKTLEFNIKMKKLAEVRIKVIEEILNEREPDFKFKQFLD